MSYFVYFLRSGPDAIKVGWCENPARRLYDLQIGSPDQLQYAGLLRLPTKQAARRKEKRIHEMLSPWRIRGEWFRPPEKEIRQAMRGAEPYEPPEGVTSRGRVSEARTDPDRHPRSSIRWSEIDYPEWLDDVDRRNLRRLYGTPGGVRDTVRRLKHKRGIRRGRRPSPPS